MSDEARRRKEAVASQSVNLPRFLQLSMKLLEIHHLEWSINSVCNVSDAILIYFSP